MGVGTVLTWAGRVPPTARRTIMLVLVGAAVMSPVYTLDRVLYHFTEEPRLVENRNTSTGLDGFHYELLKDTADYISTHDGPLYLPVNHLNQRIPTAWLRPMDFPNFDPYMGEDLPAVPLFIPLEANRYEWPPMNRPTTFVLANPANQTMTLDLHWAVLAAPNARYTVFVHLLDADGTLIAQQDVQPLNGRYPTDTWRADTRLITSHTLTVPEDANTPQSAVIGWYDAMTFERLPVMRAGDRLPDDVLRLPD